jgi:glutamate formiminotransferase/formiminotetrahydrofolate cyclodeaminase
MALIECVPNFSEGREAAKIEAIVSSIEAVDGVRVLHVDQGYDANRTVVTFAGDPEAVAEAAFRAVQKAALVIDMTSQKGAHPRFGATDVCPFIPLAGSSFADCVEISRSVGERVAEELGIPVYLYGLSALTPQRADLSYVRKGEYEGLERRMSQEGFCPDFGPSSVNRQTGATAVGARDFLIAFNVNLSTKDASLARTIAAQIRKLVKLNLVGDKARQSDYTKSTALPPLKAIGWSMPTFGLAQISINLLDFQSVGMFEAFELVKGCAEKEGISVLGSELVGLVPKAALLAAGAKVIAQAKAQKSDQNENKSEGDDPIKDEISLLSSAVKYLGLEAVEPFALEERVLEYRLEKLGLTLNF